MRLNVLISVVLSLFWYPRCRSYIYFNFFCPSVKLLDILPWHCDNILFLQMFDNWKTCCSVTACSWWPLVQHHHQAWTHCSHQYALLGIIFSSVTHSSVPGSLQSVTTQIMLPVPHSRIWQNIPRLGSNFLLKLCLQPVIH